jgi:hypothetical protein
LWFGWCAALAALAAAMLGAAVGAGAGGGSKRSPDKMKRNPGKPRSRVDCRATPESSCQ